MKRRSSMNDNLDSATQPMGKQKSYQDFSLRVSYPLKEEDRYLHPIAH